MIKGRLFLVLSAIAAASNAAAQEFPRTFEAEVTEVTDGDTVKVLTADGTEHRLRLQAVDAPESDQPYGDEATRFVEEQVLGKTVAVTAMDEDTYGRLISFVEFDDMILNEELLRKGLAWWFYQYSDDLELAGIEADARANRRGLFADYAPISPRVWRHGGRVEEEGAPNAVSATTPVVILGLLPNPDGADAGSETVILGNQSNLPQLLSGWTLLDDDDGCFALTGRIEPGGSCTITLDATLQLGNSGDVILLRDACGHTVQSVEYSNAASGRFVSP